MYSEHPTLSPFLQMRNMRLDQLEEMRVYFFDKWCWVTGAEIDQEIVIQCEHRIRYLNHLTDLAERFKL